MEYIKYFVGDPALTSHIDAVHAASPNSDLYTEEIVKGVTKSINASSIIGRVPRDVMDLNRRRTDINAPAIDEYRFAIKQIVASKNILNERNKLMKNYLHLAIHGMKDNEGRNAQGYEFAIGTLNDRSCHPEITDWLEGYLKNVSKKVNRNGIFPGDESKAYHRIGDRDYQGYGDLFHTIQLEINHSWRKNNTRELIIIFNNILTEFDQLFNPSI